MLRNKRYSPNIYPTWDSASKKHRWNISTAIFHVDYGIQFLFFYFTHVIASFSFPLPILYLFSLAFHLNYLNGSGNPEPGIFLWSNTTATPLVLLYLRISSNFFRNFFFFSFFHICKAHIPFPFIYILAPVLFFSCHFWLVLLYHFHFPYRFSRVLLFVLSWLWHIF